MTVCSAFRPFRLAGLGALSAALVTGALPAHAVRCVDENPAETAPAADLPAPTRGPDAASRDALRALVERAVARSQAVGAARLLAEAAANEVDEAKAGALPRADLTGGVIAIGTSGQDITSSRGTQARAGVNVVASLYDAGRVAELTGWRRGLAEAARLGEIGTQEEIGLQTVSLALERGRYSVQARVYRQYAEKLSCLVDALEQIVRADRGRASELVQAQKNRQQVELSQEQTASALRQVETKLRRFVGDPLPETGDLAAALLELPPLATLQAEAERAVEIVQLDAQIDASASYARAVVAGQKPQVSWVVSGNRSAGVGGSNSVSAGLNVNIPLYSPADIYTASAARLRTDAARRQRADALEARRFRMADVHEQAAAAFDRARRVVDVVRISNEVRNSTLLQWQQLGRRSLFDVMAAEGDYYSLRLAHVNALYDGEQSAALLRSLGLGLAAWLQ